MSLRAAAIPAFMPRTKPRFSRQADDPQPFAVSGQAGRRLVFRAVVHDDDFGLVEVAGQQGVEAAPGQRPLVPCQHDQGGAAHYFSSVPDARQSALRAVPSVSRA